MNKNEVKHFLRTHRNMEVSAARLEYTRFVTPGMDEKAMQLVRRFKKPTAEEIEIEDRIRRTDDPAELVNLMRKPIPLSSNNVLRQKLLDMEEQVLPLIKRKALRNGQDYFIENTVYILLRSEEEPCDWIMENYSRFASEYLKGLLCLVLGCRGEVELIPFLIAEAERLERMYPKESYDQGALIGVQELAYRFLN